MLQRMDEASGGVREIELNKCAQEGILPNTKEWRERCNVPITYGTLVEFPGDFLNDDYSKTTGLLKLNATDAEGTMPPSVWI